MSLYEKLDRDAKNALKEGNALKVSVLRMALSTIKTMQIEKNIKSLDDDSVIQILQRHVKQHRESIEQFGKGGRSDLVEKEKAELKILEEYLPEQLSEEELTAIVKTAIAETGAASKSDTGKVMKAVMEKAKGRADGKVINKIVLQLLVSALFFALVSASYAQEKQTVGAKLKSFWQKLFSYPANVTNETAGVVTEAITGATGVVTKEVKTVGQVTSGDLQKTKDLATEPLVGTAQTTKKVIEDTVAVPINANK